MSTKSSDPQAHTDKYTLVAALDPDTDEIKTLTIDDLVRGLNVQLHVYNPSTMKWEKMQQPTIEAGDLYIALDDVEDKLDNLLTELEGKADLDETQPVSVTKTGSAVDSNNSTVAALGIDGVFTGTSTDLLGYSGVIISILTDQNSATDGLSIEFSSDGTNWDFVNEHTIEANESHIVSVSIIARYFRVVYTNGGVGQTVFRMSTLLLPVNVVGHHEKLDGDLDDENIAVLTRSVITGETTAGGGGFVNVKVNPSGTLETVANQDTAADLNMTEASAVSILAGVDDQLLDYKFSGYVVSGTAVYIGYEDKGGAYYVQYIETSTGVVTYAVGAGGIVAPGSYSGLSYGSFASKF